MGDNVSVPALGMWELAESRCSVAHLPEHWNATPLTGAESKDFGREIDERRGRWRDCCAAHLQDLHKIYRNGIPR
jgi:hypothetical protein